MITAEELKTLRGRGVQDSDILKEYRDFDHEASGDIDTLLKRGETPTTVLDGLADYYGGADAPKAETRPDPMADKSALEKTKGLAQFGGANLARGLAKTAKAAGWTGTGDTLEKVAHGIEPAPGSYDPAGPRFDYSDPSTWGYAPRAVLEGAPGVAADLTAGALGTAVGGPVGGIAGFMGMNAARNYGGNLEARMEHQAPGATPSNTDYAAAGASTVAEAALSRLGINPAISGVAKGAGLKAMAQVPALIAKATGAEAASGAAGDIINQVGRTAGTRDGLSVDPKEAGNVAALSGLTGGALRTARGVADVTNAARFSGVNEDAAARAVARMDAMGIKGDNAETAYKRVEMARKTADVELDDAHQIIKPLLKSKGNDTATDETRTLVRSALTQLKANDELNPEHVSTLRDRLGDTQEGSRLLDLMDERNALNQLSSKGRYDDRTGTFAGGLATNPVVDTVLNPGRHLGLKMVGGAGALGAAEIPAFAQASVLGPALAKLAATQAGAYGAVRTLDNVTGMRNPAQEFSDRFRGLQKLSGDDLPSFRQEAVDAQAQEASAKALQDRVKALKARSKQEGQAWRAKDAQDRAQAAQEARQAYEADKAWESREAAPGARETQEEAMWRQADAQRAQEAQDDATAQAGIHAGYSELLKRAVLAGQATKKLREGQEATQQRQVDTSWATKAQQDAQEARQSAAVSRDYGRAEAQRNAATPEAIGAAQEEAMWRSNETQRAQEASGAPTDWSDQDAIAAIQKVISARQKASEFIVGQSRKEAPQPAQEAPGAPPAQTNADPLVAVQQALSARMKLSETLDTQAEKASQQRKARAPNKATKEPKAEQPVQQPQAQAVTSPSLRERIEDAYYSLTGGKNAESVTLDRIRKSFPDVDRETMDAEFLKMLGGDKEGGNTARFSQFSSPKSITPEIAEAAYSPAGEPFHVLRLQGKMPRKAPPVQPEAVPEAGVVPEALRVKVRAKAKAEKASGAKVSEPAEISPETIRITHGDQVVERPKASIRNPEAYVAKTRSRMEVRQSFVDDILSETGKPGKQIMDAMLTKLNSVARSWDDAHSIIEDYINELPERHWGKAWDAYSEHEGRLRGTYGQ